MTERGVERLRVATYNVHGGIGVDGRYDPQRIVRVIEELDADLLVLQEVEARRAPGRELDQFELYAGAYGVGYIRGPTVIERRGHFGNLLLSRLPLRRARLHDLGVAGRERRVAIEAELEIAAQRLRVVGLHLGLRPGERRRQLDRLAAELDDAPMPTLYCGDTNSPFGGVLRHSAIPYTGDSGPAPRSFPSRWPLLALDRVWADPPQLLAAVTAWRSTLARVASDHLPVIAELRLGALPAATPAPAVIGLE
jgi:endonuclease/exonuclease/phosphatase family metal-dependent hydrolase